MTAKARQPYRFKEKEPAIVVRGDKVVDEGFVYNVGQTKVFFFNQSGHFFTFKRKGDRWIEFKKDHYELKPKKY